MIKFVLANRREVKWSKNACKKAFGIGEQKAKKVWNAVVKKDPPDSSESHEEMSAYEKNKAYWEPVNNSFYTSRDGVEGRGF